MNVRPSILCPIDFSEGSAGALRYAAAIASYFATRLIVLSVEDPLLTEAADLTARRHQRVFEGDGQPLGARCDRAPAG